jgi:hypothetical protein
MSMLRPSFLAGALFASTAVFAAAGDHVAAIDHSATETRGNQRVVWLHNLAEEAASVELREDSVSLARLELAAGATTRAAVVRGSLLAGTGSAPFAMIEAPVGSSSSDSGTGFDTGPVGWTNVRASYYDPVGGRYYSPTLGCYCSTTKVEVTGSISPIAGFNVRWTASFTPPASAHVHGRRYEWYATINDWFTPSTYTFAWAMP